MEWFLQMIPDQRRHFCSFDALSIYNCSVQCKEMSKKCTLQNENVIGGFLGKPTLLATAQEAVGGEESNIVHVKHCARASMLSRALNLQIPCSQKH